MKKIVTMIPFVVLVITFICLLAGCVSTKRTVVVTNPDGTTVTNEVAYVDPAYVQSKAHAVSLLVAGEALKAKPSNRVPLTTTLGALDKLVAKDVVTASDVANIVASIPKVKDSKNYFYVTAGILILQDDLNRLAVAQPELFKAAMQGADLGVREALAQ